MNNRKYLSQIFLTSFLALFFYVIHLYSQQSGLTIKQIMQGEKFTGYAPGSPQWSMDGQYIYFSWNPDFDTLSSEYKINISNNEISKVSDEELKARANSRGAYNSDRTMYVYANNGDIYLKDLVTDYTQPIFNTLAGEYNPVFSSDDTRIFYISANNYYSYDLTAGNINQLSDFRSGTEKKDPKKKGIEEWLEKDQLEHFQVLRERDAINKLRRKKRERLESEYPGTIYYGKDRIGILGISPDGKFIHYRLTKDANEKRTLVPDYVTQSGETENLYSRPKVGGEQDEYENWIFNTELDTAYRLDVSGLPGIKNKPDYYRLYHNNDTEYADTFVNNRPVFVTNPVFSEGGKAVVVIRSEDNKDRWIALVSQDKGQLSVIDHQHDDAWIGGPGIIGWNTSTGTIGWIGENDVYFQSEQSGYSHLCRYNINTGIKKQLTEGNFEILSADLSLDKSTFFITSNKETPYQQHFYHLPAEGGGMKKITTGSGGYQVTLSPDESKLAIRYSQSNQPWELFIMDNRQGARMTRLTTSTTEEFKKYNWRIPEIIEFTARDGVQVPARLYKPKDSEANGAGVVFVHGAGYLQNVHEWWSSYFREYMFHNFLADHGYTVIDIDYRASAGYGRDWRTAIYRWMGGHDLNDNIDGARYLVEAHGVDPDRIGIYGGSYGGFITLMAMFTAPDVFEAGAALRSVTDWAHYNHGYTSNILNTPITDSIAYRKSSPIYYADGLKGHLVMLHGMVDDNVQFQDVVRMSQRLIELEKENWELVVFPMESHGFVEPSSWTDEYRRIFELFEERLRR